MTVEAEDVEQSYASGPQLWRLNRERLQWLALERSPAGIVDGRTAHKLIKEWEAEQDEAAA